MSDIEAREAMVGEIYVLYNRGSLCLELVKAL